MTVRVKQQQQQQQQCCSGFQRFVFALFVWCQEVILSVNVLLLQQFQNVHFRDLV